MRQENRRKTKHVRVVSNMRTILQTLLFYLDIYVDTCTAVENRSSRQQINSCNLLPKVGSTCNLLPKSDIFPCITLKP